MRKPSVDFKKRNEPAGETWFDPEYDNDLIVASFAAQYGIRLAQEYDTITYAEWARLLNGIMADTPLGRVISIRSETDKDTIKRFSKHEHKLRKDWVAFRASQQKANYAQLDIKQLQDMLKSMFPSKTG